MDDSDMKLPLKMISDAVDMGIQQYMKTMEPASDLIKKTEAKRLVRSMGFRLRDLEEWTDKGLLQCTKTEGAKNTAVWYSISELKRIAFAIRYNQHISV